VDAADGKKFMLLACDQHLSDDVDFGDELDYEHLLMIV